MPESGFPRGDIARLELAALAELFDRFEYAWDPREQSVAEAKAEFCSRVQLLYDERIHLRYPGLAFVTFQIHVQNACRLFLRKNKP
jgi:hypothetical protein